MTAENVSMEDVLNETQKGKEFIENMEKKFKNIRVERRLDKNEAIIILKGDRKLK